MAKAPVEKAPTQRERFIKAAREIGANEDEKSFEQQLGAVAGANSSTGAKKSKPARASTKK
ncbi:MAG: hypothetical protein CTY31_05090 [Hyphomicrobium sp.]|nr:MAG: hypothetical protein CTY39_03370 [Hyphomicrobium sp.]PPD00494.1 MAG: hypothetical protein CTY31_05090 [Hyphomicrobium sp.]